jgi:hypothetical protein
MEPECGLLGHIGTAKALGVTVPPLLRVPADGVVE